MNLIECYNLVIVASTTTKEDWSSTTNSIGQFFLIFLIFGVFIALLYFSNKWVHGARFPNKHRNMKVMESLNITATGNLQIVKIGESYILLGITKDKITFLKDLDEKSLILYEGSVKIDESKSQFENALQRFLKPNNKSEEVDGEGDE